LLTASVLAAAEDSVDSDILELRSEDAAVRDAAQRRLIEKGESALGACRRVLESEKDAEAASRLREICARIEQRKKIKAVQELWRDRWFVDSIAGTEVGWLHLSARSTMIDGKAGWTFVFECQNETPGMRTTWRCKTTCRDDDDLTPKELEWSEDDTDIEDNKVSTEHLRQRVLVGTDSFEVEVLDGENPALKLGKGEKRTLQIERAGTPLSIGHVDFYLAEMQLATGREAVRRLGFSPKEPTRGVERIWTLGKAEDIEIGADTISTVTLSDPDDLGAGKYWVSESRGVVKFESLGVTTVLSDESGVEKLKLRLLKQNSK